MAYADPEKKRANQAAYYKAHAKEKCAYASDYRKANRDRLNSYLSEYRTRPYVREAARMRNARPDVVAARKAYKARPQAHAQALAAAMARRQSPRGRAYQAERSKSPKVRAARRRSALRCLYGITDLQHDTMRARQGNACGLCARLFGENTRNCHVDHDKKTGRVRGLLDWRCNRFLHDWMTPEWLRAAADYKESSFDGRSL